MTQTKIRIDLSQGIVEVEGSEAFVSSIYSDFKERIHPSGTPTARREAKTKPPKTETTKKRRAGAPKTIPTIVKDLDLSEKGKNTSLKGFYAQYKPKSNQERNLIFVCYLQQILEVSPITANHVFTCYRGIPGLRMPGVVYQSLLDTSSRKGWLDTKSMEDIKATVPGINYLEHDLPKASKSDDA